MPRFEVTVTAVGCIFVDAPTMAAARKMVNEMTMKTFADLGSFSDDSPTVTDVMPDLGNFTEGGA